MAKSLIAMKPPAIAEALASAPVVAVACSGGSDSAAALLRTRALAPRADIVACYVDHGVRSRASIRRDIGAVREQAAVAGARVLVAHLHFTGARTGHKSEAVLRSARYAALAAMAKRVGATVVVAGQHAGDIAEWVLIAMLRGAGVDGVAVMPDVRPLAPGIDLVRPFLNESKASLAETVRRRGLPVSIDETNEELRYARNLVRAFLAAWTAYSGGVPEKTLARSAKLLREDRGLLESLVKLEYDRARANGDALEVRALRTMAPSLLRRVIRMAVREATGTATDFTLAHCDAIARAVHARRGGEFHAGNAKVMLSAGKLRVLASKPRGQQTRVLRVRLRAAVIPRDPTFTIRTSLPGDTCIPSGRRSPVSLARFLAKAGVPRDRRASVPLLLVDGRIAAALGVRVMEPFTPRPGEATVDVKWRSEALSGRAGAADRISMEQTRT